MRRFFINSDAVTDDMVLIEGEMWHYLSHVLRLKAGERIEMLTDDNKLYIVELISFEEQSIKGRIIDTQEYANDTKVEINLYQGLPKGDKLDLIIQKCTELGISSITPIEMPRSIAKIGADKADKKVARWQKIAQEASQQSKRCVVPKIHNPLSWKGFLNEIKGEEALNLLLWEDESTVGLKSVLNQYEAVGKINIIIGPEGGLGAEEAEELKKMGIVSVSLGKRILRTETAGLAAVAIILYHYDDLG